MRISSTGTRLLFCTFSIPVTCQFQARKTLAFDYFRVSLLLMNFPPQTRLFFSARALHFRYFQGIIPRSVQSTESSSGMHFAPPFQRGRQTIARGQSAHPYNFPKKNCYFPHPRNAPPKLTIVILELVDAVVVEAVDVRLSPHRQPIRRHVHTPDDLIVGVRFQARDEKSTRSMICVQK